MTLRVGDIMRPPITISPRATVIEAARLMREKNIGWLIVVTGQQPIGIVTERDLLYKVTAAGLFTESTNVMQVMTSKLVVGTPKMSVQEAIAVMSRHSIRRLPIVNHDKLAGVVTSRDIFSELDKHPARPPTQPRQSWGGGGPSPGEGRSPLLATSVARGGPRIAVPSPKGATRASGAEKKPARAARKAKAGARKR